MPKRFFKVYFLQSIIVLMKMPKIIHEQKPKHISPGGNQHMLILYKSYKKN